MTPTLFPDQPPPIASTGDVWAHMIVTLQHEQRFPDLLPIMEERRAIGIARYNLPLQIHNGRDHRIDAAQELPDAAAFLWAADYRDDARRCLRVVQTLVHKINLTPKE